MTPVSVVPPDGGEPALDGQIRLRILEDGSTTAHRLGIAEITIAPHTGGPPQHRHGLHDEGFYVAAGTAIMTRYATEPATTYATEQDQLQPN